MNFQGQNNDESGNPLSQTSTSQQISTSTNTTTSQNQYGNKNILEQFESAVKDIEEAKKGIGKNETTMFFVVIVLLVMVGSIILDVTLFAWDAFIRPEKAQSTSNQTPVIVLPSLSSNQTESTNTDIAELNKKVDSIIKFMSDEAAKKRTSTTTP